MSEKVAAMSLQRRNRSIGSKLYSHGKLYRVMGEIIEMSGTSVSSEELYREESDSMGKIEVLANRYYGAQTARSLIQAKGRQFGNVVKVGRTHLMDASPLAVGHDVDPLQIL